ncbi:9252_t:CDS:2, partial [Dentiscutata erythropus]
FHIRIQAIGTLYRISLLFSYTFLCVIFVSTITVDFLACSILLQNYTDHVSLHLVTRLMEYLLDYEDDVENHLPGFVTSLMEHLSDYEDDVENYLPSFGDNNANGNNTDDYDVDVNET